MSTAIHWFRRDLRVSDNPGLRAAARHDRVLPIYIPSTWKERHHWCGAHRQAFLCGCLESLHRNLEVKGGRLLVRTGAAVQTLLDLAAETGAEEIHANGDPDPFGRAVEAELAARAEKAGVRVVIHRDHSLLAPDAVLTEEGEPFRVFTPYARTWMKREQPRPGPAIGKLRVPAHPPTERLPKPGHWGLEAVEPALPPGEAAARKRLGRFLDGAIYTYADRRDLPGEDGTSRLSQDLRWGLLSIREVCAQVAEAMKAAKTVAQRNSAGTFLNELIWREFYLQVLWHAPDVLEHEYQPETRSVQWRAHWRPEQEAWDREPRARGDFHRWSHGLTGFPIVDAGMRQLAATGFMHNRVRMIVAMFLTKDLHLWWMHGESWFMRHLTDGEIASNNGGWQWSASTGTDAAPYFRIQNPWSQSKRFDPDGTYIKRWVPELRDVPAARLHAPPEGVLAKDYPRPMVDHAQARERALEMFRKG